MRYLGGKHFLASKHLDVICPTHFDIVWEPFVGGANVTLKLLEQVHPNTRIIVSDNNSHLMKLYNAALKGVFPSDRGGLYPTQLEYRAAKKANRQSALLTLEEILIGFACGYGGYFTAYARKTTQDFYADALRFLHKLEAASKRICEPIMTICYDFLRDPPIIAGNLTGVLIYCDPPYRGTRGYPGPRFRHDVFFDRCREYAKRGAKVYVAEYAAPSDFVCVWEGTKPNMMSNMKSVNGHAKRTVEKLFLCDYSRE
jgi:site-specific DNA-adenine methylase